MANTLSLIRSGVADGTRWLVTVADAVRPTLTWPGHCYRAWRERQALARLDDRLLKDIGVSRGEIFRETTRGFFDPPPMRRRRSSSGPHQHG